MKKNVLLFFLLANYITFANFGDFASAVGISSNGGNSTVFYNTSGSGVNLIGSTSFGGDLGSFYTNSGAIRLTGAEIKTWRWNESNVCGGTLYYTIYETGNRPSSPVFSNFALPFKANCNNGTFSDGTGACGGNDQKWSTAAQSVNLTNYAAGNYTLELYYQYTGQAFGSGCGTTNFINNSGNNFTMTFSLNNPEITFQSISSPTSTD